MTFNRNIHQEEGVDTVENPSVLEIFAWVPRILAQKGMNVSLGGGWIFFLCFFCGNSLFYYRHLNDSCIHSRLIQHVFSSVKKPDQIEGFSSLTESEKEQVRNFLSQADQKAAEKKEKEITELSELEKFESETEVEEEKVKRGLMRSREITPEEENLK